MKAIKLIIGIFILFAGMLIIGESHTFRLNNFYTQFDSTTLYLQPNTTEQEMIQDTLQSAQRHGVEVFTYLMTPGTADGTEFKIYGTSGVEAYFRDHLDIAAKVYPSLLLEHIKFEFDDFQHIRGIENYRDYYVIGGKDQAKAFKIDLINKYAGNHPQDGYVSNELRNVHIGIWIMIISILLLISYYDVVYQKKESLIRVSMGESVSSIVWRNIAADSLGFAIVFALIVYSLSRYTYVYFDFTLSLFFFAALLILNGALYINLYFNSLKEVFSNAKGSSKKLLTLNYSLKLVTIVITILVISGNVALMLESYQLYKQRAFFETHKDYSYTRLYYKMVVDSNGSVNPRYEESDKVNAAFFQTFAEKSGGLLLTTTEGLTANREGIYANRNALSYLASKIKEIDDIEFNKDMYFFLPKKRMNEQGILDELRTTVQSFDGGNFQYDYDLIYYEDNIEVLRINEDSVYGSELIDNPTIIYNNVPIDQLGSEPRYRSHSSEMMYRITDAEFQQFVQDYQLSGQIVSQTNVLDKYTESWTTAKRILYMNFVFSMLVLALEFIIISSIIRLEYEVNAIELSIKKVLGHSVWEKNRKIIWMTIITTVASIGMAVASALLSGLKNVQYLALAGTFLLLLELVLIYFSIRRIERGKIQQILKGGSL